MNTDEMLADAGPEERFKALSASHKGKLGACTRKMNEIKALMETEGNVEKVNESVALFQRSLEDFNEIHESVQTFLSEDEKEKERIDWYEPKMSTFADFLKDVEKWKTSQIDPQALIGPQDSISNVSNRSQVLKRSESRSTISPVASARLKVATERAVLLARAAALERKHALNMEKAQLKGKWNKWSWKLIWLNLRLN